MAHRPRKRLGRKLSWFIAAASCVVYLGALSGATALAFAAASYLRQAARSKGFQAVMQAARRPVKQADLPRLLPGIPIYPGASIFPLFSGLTPRAPEAHGVTVDLTAPAGPEKVIAFYRAHMTGWAFDSAKSKRGMLLFRRGAERCWIKAVRAPWLSPGRRAMCLFTISYRAGEKAEP